jgi:hypothetical protein
MGGGGEGALSSSPGILPWLKLLALMAGFPLPPGGGGGGLLDGCLGFVFEGGGGGGAAVGLCGAELTGGGGGHDFRMDPDEEDGLALGVNDGVEF